MRSHVKSTSSSSSSSAKYHQKKSRAIANARINAIRTVPRGPPAILKSRKGEVKALSTSFADADAPGAGVALACNTTGTFILLNAIQAGSGFFNRVGNKIEMRSIRFTGQIRSLNVSRSAVADYLRVVIVYDRQSNGATPALTDVFQDTDNVGNNHTDSLSGINLNNRDRFAIIMDKRIMLPQATDTAGALTNVFPNSFQHEKWDTIDEYRKLKGLVTHYGTSSNPAAIGDIKSGALFLIAFTAVNAAASEIFAINNWNARLRYDDT